MTRYFTPAVYAFLRELAQNNNKEWWEDNKDRYVTTIREPARDFIGDFGDRLASVSPHFSADTRTNGGSLMRPYRDMRFASDKTPYKTNVGIQFRHERGQDAHAPGFYLHLEPGRNFAGAGMWTPEARVARRIREAINVDPVGWEKAAHSKGFTGEWSLGSHEEDRLKKIPKDLDPDHPYPDDLRLKSFTAGTKLTQKSITSTGFADDLVALYATAGPYTEFLCGAIEVEF
jgi:uncharacterized protein (TIGR02453 family)